MPVSENLVFHAAPPATAPDGQAEQRPEEDQCDEAARHGTSGRREVLPPVAEGGRDAAVLLVGDDHDVVDLDHPFVDSCGEVRARASRVRLVRVGDCNQSAHAAPIACAIIFDEMPIATPGSRLVHERGGEPRAG